jgi:hypothetical protein
LSGSRGRDFDIQRRHVIARRIQRSMGFDDEQIALIQRLSAERGVPFAQVVRDIIKDWDSLTEGGAKMQEPQHSKRPNIVALKLRDDDVSREYRNAWLEYDEYNGQVIVRREGRGVIASFNESVLEFWDSGEEDE